MNRPLEERSLDFAHCPWTIKDVFIVFSYAIALFFVFCFWLSLLYFLAGFVSGHSLHILDFVRETFKGAADVYAVLVFYAALFIAMKVKIFKKYGIREFDFFVKKDRIRDDVFYGAVMYLKFLAFVVLGVFLIFCVAAIGDILFKAGTVEKVDVFFIASNLERLETEERVTGLLGIVFLFCIAPFFEELFFRGCLYRALRGRFRRSFAILASSFIFAALHGYFFLFAYVFLVGILLAHMYEKRESLVAPLTFHMLNNLFVLILLLMKF